MCHIDEATKDHVDFDGGIIKTMKLLSLYYFLAFEAILP